MDVRKDVRRARNQDLKILTGMQCGEEDGCYEPPAIQEASAEVPPQDKLLRPGDAGLDDFIN